MRQAWECTARSVCLQIIANSLDNIQELLDTHEAVYLEMGGAHKFIFPDGSILIIDEDGEATFVNIRIEFKNPSDPTKPTWFDRLKKNKVAAAIAVGGVLLSTAAVAGVFHFHKS